MGLFAMNVKEMFPDIPMEDELRLKKDKIRHHFLTKVFHLLNSDNLEITVNQ